MYVYEGEDYSKCSDEDKKGFDQLLAGIQIHSNCNNILVHVIYVVYIILSIEHLRSSIVM